MCHVKNSNYGIQKPKSKPINARSAFIVFITHRKYHNPPLSALLNDGGLACSGWTSL